MENFSEGKTVLRITKQELFDSSLLKAWLKLGGWTCQTLSEEMRKASGIGCTEATCNKWVLGFNAPSFDSAVALSQAMRAPLDALVMGTEANAEWRRAVADGLTSIGRKKDIPWGE